MSTRFLLSFLIATSVLQACQDKNVLPKIDYDKASIELMEGIKTQIVGRWSLHETHIKYQNYNNGQRQLHIKKDTTLLNLGTLVIQPAATSRYSPEDPRLAEFEGSIEYGGKIYPVYFSLRANAEWIYSRKGPQAFLNFSYNFPIGVRFPEPEETFLGNIGLVYDTFSIKIGLEQSTMIWRGLNRGIEQIELRKQ